MAMHSVEDNKLKINNKGEKVMEGDMVFLFQ